MSANCLFSVYRKLLGPEAFMWFRGQREEMPPGATWRRQAHGRFLYGTGCSCVETRYGAVESPRVGRLWAPGRTGPCFLKEHQGRESEPRAREFQTGGPESTLGLSGLSRESSVLPEVPFPVKSESSSGPSSQNLQGPQKIHSRAAGGQRLMGLSQVDPLLWASLVSFLSLPCSGLWGGLGDAQKQSCRSKSQFSHHKSRFFTH